MPVYLASWESVHFGFEENAANPEELQVDPGGKIITFDSTNKKVNIASLYFNTDRAVGLQASSVAQFASMLVQKIEKVKFRIN